VTAVELAVQNPYWDLVADRVADGDWYTGPRQVNDYDRDGSGNLDIEALRRRAEAGEDRRSLTSRFAWTITAPDTLAFVAEHAGGMVLDPMAGTGYWAWLLTQCGVHVLAFDAKPPAAGENTYHRDGHAYFSVQLGEAAYATRVYGFGRTLLLSWPPMDEAGHLALAAYRGNRLIYIGEGEGGCCGDDDLFALIERDWVEVAEHRPVQWHGLHDYITVYDRRLGGAS
jgi:hypothetical protein